MACRLFNAKSLSTLINDGLLWTMPREWTFNSLAPGKFEWNFRHSIFKHISVIDGWGISCEIALIWMSLGFTDDQSTLFQVIAWCRQATSHYMSQCWPRSLRHMASLGHKELIEKQSIFRSPVAVEFPAQIASNAENVSIWWRHHVRLRFHCSLLTYRSRGRVYSWQY